MISYYIVGAVLVVLLILTIYSLVSIKLKLQTVNFYSGGLGSGKSLMITKTAVNLRRRSVLGHILLGKLPVVFVFVVCLLLLILTFNVKLLFFIVLSLTVFLISITFVKRNVIKSKFKIREIYSTYPILIKKGKKGKLNIYSKRFVVEHLLGTKKLDERCIIVIDEASYLFPNKAKKSDIALTNGIRWFRHYVDGTILMADQSIGDIDITIRRRVNVVYNLSSFKKILFFFYSIEVNRINYMEDIVYNVSDINELSYKKLFGVFGKRRFISRYYRKNYKPIDFTNSCWLDKYV